jgi:predicted nuclease with TOPRIM domain
MSRIPPPRPGGIPPYLQSMNNSNITMASHEWAASHKRGANIEKREKLDALKRGEEELKHEIEEHKAQIAFLEEEIAKIKQKAASLKGGSMRKTHRRRTHRRRTHRRK